MKQTKKITLSAACIALGVLFMALGAFVEVLDLTVAALSSCLMAFVFIEIGDKYAFGVWLGTSILGAIFFTHSLVWVTYFLICGIYPILKAYIEKLPKWSWLIVKLAYINAMVWALFFISEKLLGIPFFGEEGIVMQIILYVLLNVAFVAYDLFITVMVRFYYVKLRSRFKKLLK